MRALTAEELELAYQGGVYELGEFAPDAEAHTNGLRWVAVAVEQHTKEQTK